MRPLSVGRDGSDSDVPRRLGQVFFLGFIYCNLLVLYDRWKETKEKDASVFYWCLTVGRIFAYGDVLLVFNLLLINRTRQGTRIHSYMH